MVGAIAVPDRPRLSGTTSGCCDRSTADARSTSDRTTDTAAPPEPVDWDLAERVARRFAGREPLAASYLGGSLHADFSAVTDACRAAGRRLHRSARARRRVGLRARPPAVGRTPTSRRCVACSHPLTARVGRADGPQSRRAHRTARRGHRDGRAARVHGPACARPVRPARPGRSRRARRQAPSTTSAPTSSLSRSASRSGRTTSGSGSRSTR